MLDFSKLSKLRLDLNDAIKREDFDALNKLIGVDNDSDRLHNLNYVDRNGQTPLHLSCGVGNLSIVKLLVESGGANQHIKNQDGWFPIHVASFYGHYDIVMYLLGDEKASNLLDVYQDIDSGSTECIQQAKPNQVRPNQAKEFEWRDGVEDDDDDDDDDYDDDEDDEDDDGEYEGAVEDYYDDDEESDEADDEQSDFDLSDCEQEQKKYSSYVNYGYVYDEDEFADDDDFRLIKVSLHHPSKCSMEEENIDDDEFLISNLEFSNLSIFN